jgi:phage recombination protein Bet
MTNLTVIEENKLIQVLQNSLYPGASSESISMALGYCKAAGLDPMQKPVHIVPLYDSKIKAMRDVVMPGIGLYRIQAARTRQYAGISEPEFGPDVTENLGGAQITYPQWCKITVKRTMQNGLIVEFSAKEFWKENYASKGGAEKSIAPNAMWSKRPYAQIAKCAEAQALRKAFPEIGQSPTAEEMDGKQIDNDVPEYQKEPEKIIESFPVYSESSFKKNAPAWQGLVEMGKKTPEEIIMQIESKAILTDEQKAEIRSWK